MMDIFDVIKEDHRQAMDVLRSLMDTDRAASRRRGERLTRLRETLFPHMEAEESLFYPEVLGRGDLEETLTEMRGEHRTARATIDDADADIADDEAWSVRMRVLAELLEHHIGEEETRVFAIARQSVDERKAGEMARRFEEVKAGAKAHRTA